MKRITLAFVSVAAAALAAGAQEPPTPPTPPTRPTPAPVPAPAPRVRVTPVTPMAPLDLDFRYDMDLDMTRMRAELDRMRPPVIDQEQLREMTRDASRAALEASRIDVAETTRQAMEAARDAMRDIEWTTPVPPTPWIAPVPAVAPVAPMIYGTPFAGYQNDFTNRPAPAPWAQGDPADSVYNVAREALNSGDYGRAARLFNDISQKYSKSRYADAAQYYEALARYKIGTTDELHQAAKILEPMVAKLPQRASTSDRDVRVGRGQGFGGDGGYVTSIVFNRQGFNDSEVAALYARVNGVLAQRGDREAAAKVERAATQTGATCDQEDIAVKTEALNTLTQMDPATAMPALKHVLERKDECSISLRRSAVFMLGRRNDAESANLLISTAKSDPSVDVRTAAINYLGRLPGDAGIGALEDLLRNDQDERIQRAAIRALNSSDNTRARSGMRALIDRKDAPLALRLEAISSFASDRTTSDDAAYLRSLFAKADNDRMKDAILSALSRIGGSENDQFVLGVAKNPNESSQIRSAALSRLSRSPTVTTADLIKIYDTAESYDVRSRIVQIFGSRKDTESADKLFDIVRNSTDMRVRREALQAIRQRNDPRAAQVLMDILDGKKNP